MRKMYKITKDKKGIVFICNNCPYRVRVGKTISGQLSPRTVAATTMNGHQREAHPDFHR